MPTRFSTRDALLLGLLFFLICFGLGYPTLNRYDPVKLGGPFDAAAYLAAVRNPLRIASYRPFVPWLAKPFYWMALGRIGTWDPALFGMLMAASILTAATAVAIIAIGLRCRFSWSTSLVAALLFLLNFAVPNWNLAATVDSGEAFFLVMVAWSLLAARWYLLPLWAIPGSLSKETFAPFAFVFALAWWFNERPLRFARLLSVLGFGVLACAAVMLSFSGRGGFFAGAMGYTAGMGYLDAGFFAALLGCLTAHESWYTFLWLLPLGLFRLKRMDRRWVWATAAAFLLALLFGAYDIANGNVARAFFNIAGPLLSLSAAAFLADPRRQTA